MAPRTPGMGSERAVRFLRASDTPAADVADDGRGLLAEHVAAGEAQPGAAGCRSATGLGESVRISSMSARVRGCQRSMTWSTSAGISKGTSGSWNACVDVVARLRLAWNSCHDLVK